MMKMLNQMLELLLKPIKQNKLRAAGVFYFILLTAFISILFLCNILINPVLAASSHPLFLIDCKTLFLSDSVKTVFYFNQQPHIIPVESNNRLEFILDFPRCDFLLKTYKESVKDELINGVLIFKTERVTRVLIRQLQMTQTRIMQGYDKARKNFYVSVLFYRPYERYSKYEARLSEINEYKKRGVPIVLIDAGHGGKDPGAKSVYGDIEKNLNLKFARQIADNINSTGLCRAYLSRGGDQFLSLGRRVFLANQYGADAFISIHFNANKSKKVRGFEIYYLSNGTASDKASEILANIENSAEFIDENIAGEQDYQVQSILLDLKEKENIKESAILSTIITDQVSKIEAYPSSPPKQANFAVLRNLNMPSILVEVGYLSNYDDISFLRSGFNFEEICARTAIGIINYLRPEKSFDYSIVKNKAAKPPLKKSDAAPEPSDARAKLSAAVKPPAAAAEKIPAKPGKPAIPAGKNINKVEYTVKKGDTLSKIAKKFKVNLKKLMDLNNKTAAGGVIFPGEVLIISDEH
jgi:N-acetylmuramoyl-L-alanine amidase